MGISDKYVNTTHRKPSVATPDYSKVVANSHNLLLNSF